MDEEIYEQLIEYILHSIPRPLDPDPPARYLDTPVRRTVRLSLAVGSGACSGACLAVWILDCLDTGYCGYWNWILCVYYSNGGISALVVLWSGLGFLKSCCGFIVFTVVFSLTTEIPMGDLL
jgi:hypothetical protein